MKVLKITCNEKSVKECFSNVKLKEKNIISLLHFPNNHLVIESKDYDKDGHVKNSSFNDIIKSKIDSKHLQTFQNLADKEFI